PMTQGRQAFSPARQRRGAPGPPPHRGTNVWVWSPIGGWGDHNRTFAGDGHPYQLAAARSEPAPFSELTSISANLARSASEEVALPSEPKKKTSGREDSAGYVSGKITESTPAEMAHSTTKITVQQKINARAEI